MASIDPLGIPIQYTGEVLGYDVRTLGGIGFLGLSEEIEKRAEGNPAAKLLACAIFGSCWLNPEALPYMLAIEGAVTMLNVGVNFWRYKSKGNLKLK